MPAPAAAPPAVPGRADPAALRHKTLDFRFKADDDGTGSFELYAAVFGNVDRHADIIDAGAFANLDEFAADGVGLVNHDSGRLPVAWVDSAVQDSVGLKITGRFHSTPEAQAVRTVVRERMAAGKAVKCSIGYRVVDSALEKVDGRTVQRLKRLNVYEFSFVNVPANPSAGVASVKSAPTEALMFEPKNPSLIEAVKEWLGLSAKANRTMSRANFAGLKTFADALDEHGKASETHVAGLGELTKSLKAHGEATTALAGAMRKYLGKFDPDADDEAEDEPDDDKADDETETEPEADETARKRLDLRRRAGRLRP